jgi:glutamate---cysteine ligase / carboxylate-amine ligase
VRERFAASTDFSVGLEEEFQLLDPDGLGLVQRFEDLMNTAPPDLRPHLAGELISSEVEFKTAAHATFAAAARELAEGRLALIRHASAQGVATAITGCHPFSPWQDQHIIETPHYQRVEHELGYIAWINNTWSQHLHVGVRDADRAIRICTAMRSVLPEILALSANSAIYLGRATRLQSTRTSLFTRSFPRCGVPDPLTDWNEYAAFVALLERTGSIVESTQIWWSIRPHHSFGTIEVRIADGQTEMGEALAVAALSLALVARFAADLDAGRSLPAHPARLIEENLWRAQRHGLGGRMIDFARGEEHDTADAVRALVEFTAPVHDQLGLGPFLARIPVMLEEGNGAQRQARALAAGDDPVAIHAQAVERTRASAEEVLDMIGMVSST